MCEVVIAKFQHDNLEKRNMPRFFQHRRILPKLQLWLLLVNLKICLAHMLCMPKSLYDLHKYFRFAPQFFNIMNKLCIGPKKYFFQKKLLNVIIYDSRPKRGLNIFESLKS